MKLLHKAYQAGVGAVANLLMERGELRCQRCEDLQDDVAGYQGEVERLSSEQVGLRESLRRANVLLREVRADNSTLREKHGRQEQGLDKLRRQLIDAYASVGGHETQATLAHQIINGTRAVAEAERGQALVLAERVRRLAAAYDAVLSERCERDTTIANAHEVLDDIGFTEQPLALQHRLTVLAEQVKEMREGLQTARQVESLNQSYLAECHDLLDGAVPRNGLDLKQRLFLVAPGMKESAELVKTLNQTVTAAAQLIEEAGVTEGNLLDSLRRFIDDTNEQQAQVDRAAAEMNALLDAAGVPEGELPDRVKLICSRLRELRIEQTQRAQETAQTVESDGALRVTAMGPLQAGQLVVCAPYELAYQRARADYYFALHTFGVSHPSTKELEKAFNGLGGRQRFSVGVDLGLGGDRAVGTVVEHKSDGTAVLVSAQECSVWTVERLLRVLGARGNDVDLLVAAGTTPGRAAAAVNAYCDAPCRGKRYDIELPGGATTFYTQEELDAMLCVLNGDAS